MVFLNSLTQNSISDGYIRQLYMKLVGTELIDVQYEKCEFFGRIGVAIGSDSIYIYDSEAKRILRCAKTGDLLYVEKDGEYYYAYFIVEGNVVVDQVTYAQDNFTKLLRRNVVINSKYPIASIYSTADYISIIDINNNLMCIDKHEIRDSDFVRVFRSSAFTVSEEDLVEEPGFFASLFGGSDNVVFKAKAFDYDNFIVVYISCGSSDIYKCTLEKQTLRLIDYAHIDYLSGIDTYNLEALYIYDRYLEAGGSKYTDLISCNIDGRYSIITSIETENTNRHLVIDNDTYECVVSFTTESDFVLDKVLSSDDKFLCFDFSDSENRKYILIDRSGSIVAQDTTTMSDDAVVKICLLDAQCAISDTMSRTSKDEVIVEDDEAVDLEENASFNIENENLDGESDIDDSEPQEDEDEEEEEYETSYDSDVDEDLEYDLNDELEQENEDAEYTISYRGQGEAENTEESEQVEYGEYDNEKVSDNENADEQSDIDNIDYNDNDYDYIAPEEDYDIHDNEGEEQNEYDTYDNIPAQSDDSLVDDSDAHKVV